MSNYITLTGTSGLCHPNWDIRTVTSLLWHCHQDYNITTVTSQLGHQDCDIAIRTVTSQLGHQDCDITTVALQQWKREGGDLIIVSSALFEARHQRQGQGLHWEHGVRGQRSEARQIIQPCINSNISFLSFGVNFMEPMDILHKK